LPHAPPWCLKSPALATVSCRVCAPATHPVLAVANRAAPHTRAPRRGARRTPLAPVRHARARECVRASRVRGRGALTARARARALPSHPSPPKWTSSDGLNGSPQWAGTRSSSSGASPRARRRTAATTVESRATTRPRARARWLRTMCVASVRSSARTRTRWRATRRRPPPPPSIASIAGRRRASSTRPGSIPGRAGARFGGSRARACCTSRACSARWLARSWSRVARVPGLAARALARRPRRASRARTSRA
jgi:hypothetical protein